MHAKNSTTLKVLHYNYAVCLNVDFTSIGRFAKVDVLLLQLMRYVNFEVYLLPIPTSIFSEEIN